MQKAALAKPYKQRLAVSPRVGKACSHAWAHRRAFAMEAFKRAALWLSTWTLNLMSTHLVTCERD